MPDVEHGRARGLIGRVGRPDRSGLAVSGVIAFAADKGRCVLVLCSCETSDGFDACDLICHGDDDAGSGGYFKLQVYGPIRAGPDDSASPTAAVLPSPS